MVGVQYLLRMLQIQIVLRTVVPRQVQHLMQVIRLHRIIGRLRIQAFHLVQLLVEQLPYILVPLLFCRAFLQLLELLVRRITAQLILDGLDLLVEEILPLLLVDVRLHLLLDIVFQLQQIDLPA